MSNPNQVGAFIPSSEIWDVSQIYQTDVTSPEFKELLVRMYQNLNRMALLLNVKETGYYDTVGSLVDGNLWFPLPGLNSTSSRNPAYRQEERVVLNFPDTGGGFALPAVSTVTLAHNITTNKGTIFVDLWGMATDTTGLNYYPINYAGAATISAFANATVVSITNNTAINFDICYVVIAYLQN